MKVIIAGCRHVPLDKTHYYILTEAIRTSGFDVTEVVSGCARGADSLGEMWAENNHIPVKRFPARWKREDGSFDKGAGVKRNGQMAIYGEALLALWDSKSPGTANMIRQARARSLPVHVQEVA